MAKAQAATTLPAIVPPSEYAVMQTDPAELREIIAANSGGKVGARDLQRLVNPSVGGSTWLLQTAEGEEELSEITGVIVHRDHQRAYYAGQYEPGSSNPPNCYSLDMERGIGDPGTACEKCPFNAFGSAKVGAGKACREYANLYVLTPDALLPVIVRVPPTSLQLVRKYFNGLTTAKPPVAYWNALTTIAVHLPNRGATPELRFRMVGRVTSQLAQHVKTLRSMVADTPKVAMHEQPGAAVDDEIPF